MGSADFRALVAEHKNKLFRMACWMLHDQSEAEDIVQEVFLKMWEKQTDHIHYRSIEAYHNTLIGELGTTWLNPFDPAGAMYRRGHLPAR